MVKKQFSYNEAIEKIESIISKLENEEIDLDNLSENVKTATELISRCKEKLRESEEDIEKIIQQFSKEKL
jgi:exodeoxyribonuclease VII small subunit